MVGIGCFIVAVLDEDSIGCLLLWIPIFTVQLTKALIRTASIFVIKDTNTQMTRILHAPISCLLMMDAKQHKWVRLYLLSALCFDSLYQKCSGPGRTEEHIRNARAANNLGIHFIAIQSVCIVNISVLYSSYWIDAMMCVSRYP